MRGQILVMDRRLNKLRMDVNKIYTMTKMSDHNWSQDKSFYRNAKQIDSLKYAILSNQRAMFPMYERYICIIGNSWFMTLYTGNSLANSCH